VRERERERERGALLRVRLASNEEEEDLILGREKGAASERAAHALHEPQLLAEHGRSPLHQRLPVRGVRIPRRGRAPERDCQTCGSVGLGAGQEN